MAEEVAGDPSIASDVAGDDEPAGPARQPRAQQALQREGP
jgi:hypothetical protein